MKKIFTIFVIALVLSLPFISANALASITVTKNQGSAGIENYVNGNSDIWEVEAEVVDSLSSSIQPEQIAIILDNGVRGNFQSCSGSALGTTCTFLNPLSTRSAGTRTFTVQYTPEGAPSPESQDSGTLNIDSDIPQVFSLSAEQVGTEVSIDFDVTDPNIAAGIKKIEIIDITNNQVLETIDFEDIEVRSYNYASESAGAGILPVTFSGEGMKGIRVIAEDWLGQVSIPAVKQFDTDFVNPSIDRGSLSFPDVGGFVGSNVVQSDMVLNVTDGSDEVTVTAESSSLDFLNPTVRCSAEGNDLWECKWPDVDIESPNFEVTLTAEDEFGNTAIEIISESFTPDNIAPRIDYFGTERQFNDINYVKTGNNRIILIANDEGAGIDLDSMNIDLSDIGRFTGANNCEEDGNTINCKFDVNKRLTESDSPAIWINSLEDKVGNEDASQFQRIELVVDNKPPVVESLEFYGYSANGGQKDYFQGKDQLGLTMLIDESSGFVLLIDMNDLTTDPHVKYPETRFNPAGFATFTENDCERDEGVWKCQLLTEGMKSGPSVRNVIRMQLNDTAGNPVEIWNDDPVNVEGENGRYSFELLGLDEETVPDYWSVDKVLPQSPSPSRPFVDLLSTKFAKLRMPVKLEMSADSGVSALNIDLASCTAEEGAPSLSDYYLFGRNTVNNKATPTIILELEQFDGLEYFGEEKNFYLTNYTCQMKIYSEVDRKAGSVAEIQDVPIELKFAKSKLGARDEALEEKIKDARDVATFAAWSWTDEVKQILDIINFANNYIVQPILGILKLYDLINIWLGPVQKGALPAYAVVTGFCETAVNTQGVAYSINKGIQPWIGIITCSDNPIGFIAEWQKKVVEYYNYLTVGANVPVLSKIEGVVGFVQDPMTVSKIDDNLIVSGIGLCIPGIIYNLDKYRQISCRYVYCLENEVAEGIPPSVCGAIKDRMICKYVIGDLMEVIPGIRGLDALLQFLKSIIQDFIGTGLNVLFNLCGALCPVDSTEEGICNLVSFVSEGRMLFNMVASAIQTAPSIGQSYCSLIEDSADAQEEAEEEEE